MRSLSMQRLLAALADNVGARFQSGGKPVSSLLVFNPDAFLPIVALRAESAAQDLMGWTLGAKFAPSDGGVFGVSVESMPVQASLFNGTLLGLMYSRAAAECFNWGLGEVVDLHRIYGESAPLMARLRAGQRVSGEGAAQ